MPLYEYESDRTLERSQSDVERANPSLVCPITSELFRDPVLCIGDGFTYERVAAEKWFADGKTTSPMTGAELPESQRRLVPNFNARTRADQARGGAPNDGVRVNDFSIHVEDQSANDSGFGMPRSGSFSALDPPSPAEPAEPSAPEEAAESDAETLRPRENQNHRDAPRAVPYDGSRVYVISSDGKYLTDPGARFVSLLATERPFTGSEWIFKKSGKSAVAFKSAAALTGEYDHAHFNNHGHGRVEMWTKGGDAGHFTLHVASGGGSLVKIETLGGKYLTHEEGNVFGRDGGLKWRIVPTSEHNVGTHGASSSSSGAGSSGIGSSAKTRPAKTRPAKTRPSKTGPSKEKSLMDWVRGYRGANGGPRRNQLGAFSWFDGVSKSRPLHRAAMRGEVETIRSLCRAGRDPNEKMVEWFDSEPLGWAASFGQLDSVRALIEFGADPLRPPNKAGNTPMSDARRERHQHVIRFLEEYQQRAEGLSTPSPGKSLMDWVRGYRGANGGPRRNQLGAFSWFDGVSKSRPLHRAAMRGEVETIRSLCRAGRDPNEKMVEWFDSEPLGWAASFGQLDSVRALIEFGADPLRPPNKAGNTPMSDARRERHQHVIRFLEEYQQRAEGLSTPSPGEVRRCPPLNPSLNGELNDCARNTNDTGRLRDLVARGADLTSTNGAPWHHTPMHQSAYHNRPDMVETLVELCAERGVLERVLAMGSNPCGCGGSGTPADLARGGGHRRCVEILVGAHSGRITQTMSRDTPPVIHPAYDLQGCWGCCSWPGCCACETKVAEGPDALRHTGVCLPFPVPYSEVWDREGRSNTFLRRGEDDRITYPEDNPDCIWFGSGNPDCIWFGSGVAWRWCK